MDSLSKLLQEVRSCRLCQDQLPFGANPVMRASAESKLLIVGQAPGRVVHQTGIPWNDLSGDQLRKWLCMDREQFYDVQQVALMPMGFCYPGTGKSGDFPPRPECAPHWHERLLVQMPKVELILLVGAYAQNYYLGKNCKSNLTKTVAAFEAYLPRFLPLPHPSPRNRRWLSNNPWFEELVLPVLRDRLIGLIDHH